MDPDARFRVNSQIIWETIEGEVLLINLGTGNYYSLRGTGAAIWNAVAMELQNLPICGMFGITSPF